jgi:hypothetical protein
MRLWPQTDGKSFDAAMAASDELLFKKTRLRDGWSNIYAKRPIDPGSDRLGEIAMAMRALRFEEGDIPADTEKQRRQTVTTA